MDQEKSGRGHGSSAGVGHHASSGMCYTGEKRKANIGNTQTSDLDGLILLLQTYR